MLEEVYTGRGRRSFVNILGLFGGSDFILWCRKCGKITNPWICRLANMQIIVEGPGAGNRALTMDPHQTLAEVKASVLLSSHPRDSSFYFLSCGGKAIGDCSITLGDLMSNNKSSSILHLRMNHRALGGGGDGGATGAESRDCYLNMYATKKPDKVDPNETRICKWTTCALSQEPLNPPCVVDRLGNLFNKDSLVRSLLAKNLPKQFNHIKGLKDVLTIHLAPMPGRDNGSETRFQCPVTDLEFNGKYKFFALRGCGHVLSAKALKEVQSTSCLVCHAPFSESDKIVINGSDEEVIALRLQMEEERASKLRERKPKKVKNGEAFVEVDAVDKRVQKVGMLEQVADRVSVARAPKRKVEENEEKQAGDGKDKAKAASKKFRAVDQAPANATKEVYASIFTSSKKSTFKETYTCRALPLGRN